MRSTSKRHRRSRKSFTFAPVAPRKAGAELARSLGLQAEALAIADEAHVADAIVGLAGKRGVAAIVVGSRGLTGLRARLEGSTSNAVLKRASCPVVVVHDD